MLKALSPGNSSGKSSDSSDRWYRAGPQWSATMMLAACFTLYEAPFWDGILTKEMDIHGSFLRNLITSSSVGNMFILIPAMLADSYPPLYVALVGAVLVASGYTIFYFGWVQLHGPAYLTYAVVFTYAWGVAWIYGASFVTAISNAEHRAKGRSIGTMLAFLYFANGWFTMVTEFEGNGHTSMKKSALRHEFIAITAVLCSPGLFKLSAREKKCSTGDACLTSTSVVLFLMMVLMFAQWLVTGGSGSTNLLNFWYGDVPFAYTLGYGVMLLFCGCISTYNIKRYGFATLHRWGRGNEVSPKDLRPEDDGATAVGAKNEAARRHQRVKQVLQRGITEPHAGTPGTLEVLARIFTDERYVLIFAIFAINIGTGQMMANRFTQIKNMYDKTQTMVAAEYNLTRPLGALCIGAMTDVVRSRTKLLLFLACMMTVAQFLFALSAVDPSLKMTSVSWFLLPMEKIPLFLVGFSTGAMFTLVPIMEIESFGEGAIGRIHGITMVGGIIGQTIFYNVVSVMLSFSATLWFTFVACGLAAILAKRLHDEHEEALEYKAPPPGDNAASQQRRLRRGGTGNDAEAVEDEEQWCVGLTFRGDGPATRDERIRTALEERQALLRVSV